MTTVRKVDILEDEIGNLLLSRAEKTPSIASMTAALAGAGAGNIDNGGHAYLVTFVTAEGESTFEPEDLGAIAVTVANKTTNGKIELANIPAGSAFVIGRNIYRTAAGADSNRHENYKLLVEIEDNTTTTYTDNIADANLGVAVPATNSTANPVFSYNAETGVGQSGTAIPARHSVTYSEEPYAGHRSFQPIGVDLPLAAGAGSDTPTNPKFLAAIMGNVIGDDALENHANYLAGLIGANSLDCSASVYPTAGIIGVLFDGAKTDSIVLADLDGDDGGAPTTARAAFGVAINNNNPSSGCQFGLSLYAPGNANYTGGGIPFTPSKADIEFHNQLQFRSLSTAITANVTTTDAPAGSLAITSHATGRGKLFVSDGSKYQFIGVS